MANLIHSPNISLGCQTEANEVIDEINMLKRRIAVKDQQNKDVDRIIRVQAKRMDQLEEEIQRLKSYVQDHSLDQMNFDEEVNSTFTIKLQ